MIAPRPNLRARWMCSFSCRIAPLAPLAEIFPADTQVREFIDMVPSLNRSGCDKCVKLGFRCKWQNAVLHFNDIGSAMLTLFCVSTLDQWMLVMWNVMDTTEVDAAPHLDANPYGAVFIILFIFCVAFAFINLFVGGAFTSSTAPPNSAPPPHSPYRPITSGRCGPLAMRRTWISW